MTQSNTGFAELVREAKSRIRETDVETVAAKIERGEDFYLIDVREDHEWMRGHLPAANHLGKGVIERDIERAVPDHVAEIVLYCGGGARSALAADALQRMGYANVWSMDGGFGAWMRSGRPVASG